MAYINFLGETNIEYLRDYHRIGRRVDAVDTRLDYPFVSKLHAVIEWKEPYWLIRDLSQNGIWVNGKRIEKQVRHILSINDRVEIAGSEGVQFEVLDLAKPVDMIYMSDQKLEHILLVDGVILPNEIAPQLGLYKCPDRDQWFSEEFQNLTFHEQADCDGEQSVEIGPYEHDDILKCGDVEWCFFLVNEDDATIEFQPEQLNIIDVEFRFDISQDEENTTLTLIHGDHEFDLGERSHHYLLAYLLRQKNSQLDSYEPTKVNLQALGWINCQLIQQELGIDESLLNIQIFRARKQILGELNRFEGGSKLIERRRGSVRMGIDRFSIYKEGVREH
ncbi:MAG: hypothetical protein ACI8XV_002351 [Arenicella sp.]|jgi:hypothetical protein